jgi:hypothetical protein
MQSRSSRLLAAADEELVLALAKQAAAFVGLTVVSSSLILRTNSATRCI